MTIQNLWDKLHVSREQSNSAASEAFRQAIAAFNRGDMPSADYWRMLGEYEHANRKPVQKQTPLTPREIAIANLSDKDVMQFALDMLAAIGAQWDAKQLGASFFDLPYEFDSIIQCLAGKIAAKERH